MDLKAKIPKLAQAVVTLYLSGSHLTPNSIILDSDPIRRLVYAVLNGRAGYANGHTAAPEAEAGTSEPASPSDSDSAESSLAISLETSEGMSAAEDDEAFQEFLCAERLTAATPPIFRRDEQVPHRSFQGYIADAGAHPAGGSAERDIPSWYDVAQASSHLRPMHLRGHFDEQKLHMIVQSIKQEAAASNHALWQWQGPQLRIQQQEQQPQWQQQHFSGEQHPQETTLGTCWVDGLGAIDPGQILVASLTDEVLIC